LDNIIVDPIIRYGAHK